ncbi:reverse transcriptase [Phytophthora megakarya]|uniref:Reverse transcriptase n=1 Tax=Phytophthora megakarya TaxID=4795 RepID=A0A225WF14_9STRA|nr:reverse transcriptase [Phytophthora megakarya]
MACLNLICMFLVISNQLGLHVHQGDIPTSYVKAKMKEVIHVRQPSGLEEESSTKVWLLKIAFYGLKQAGREWNAEINSFLLEYDLVPTREDRCV